MLWQAIADVIQMRGTRADATLEMCLVAAIALFAKDDGLETGIPSPVACEL